MIAKNILLTFTLILFSVSGFAQTEISFNDKRIYTTQKIVSAESPIIDGKLNDDIWYKENKSADNLGWTTNFIQREPIENVSPSEQTEFKIIYDSEFLYVGINCFDSEPKRINSRMSRRDGFEGDWVEIIFDSYHDLRSAFSLTITAAGVQGDKTISLNGANEDNTWNPIWYAASNISENGWTSEMKIPLSQLRFGDKNNQVWGLQVLRKFSRNEEKSVWQRIPIDAPGWVSEFGELHGLINLKPKRQLEIQPFLVSSLETFKKELLNPYRNSNIKNFNAGLDGKYGVTNNLTLDFTINPDFGQVEADPAAISLDGFQLFFNEQRPFFIENKNIFNYKFSSPIIGGPFSSDNLFYSRRIGRSPQGSVETLSGKYVKSPKRTTILGAVKFSGKTDDGLSIGVLESITSSEYAEINNAGKVSEVLVEPLTNYFVSRVQKDFNNKNTFIGGIITSTYRQIKENVNFLHRSALTGGVDFKHQWDSRTWYLGANLVVSHITGSKAAILNTQKSIRHLYQRVDAGHLTLDSNKTSLTGTGGDIRFGKAGEGNIKFETGVTWRSPGLELNDIGFMREADDIQNYLGATYSSLKPFGIFRTGSIGYKHWLVWDYEGNFNYFDWDIEVNGTFNNNWGATFGFFSQPHIFSKSLLRGGPRLHLPNQHGVWWALSSDKRKKFYFDLDGWTKTGNEDSYNLLENGISVTYQPINQFSISISPRYITIDNRLQYTDQVTYKDEQRYITSILNQETFSTALRLNYTVNSNLSVQYYGEAFITIGKYSDFNYVINPLTEKRNDQLKFYDKSQLSVDEANKKYLVDEDQNSIIDYTFTNPNFSFAQFRSNLVVRFEYNPGSEIFLVWSQGITDFSTPRSGLGNSFREQVFSKHPENTFLIKATYRFY